MDSQQNRKVASLWYQSLLVIDAVYALFLGLCLLGHDAEDVFEIAVMGGAFWFLLFYCAHLILTCAILVQGPMLLRKRVALWYLFPVLSLYRFNQYPSTIYTHFLLPGIALFVMIALPVMWLYLMKFQDT